MFRRTEFASVARVSAKAKKYIYVGAVSFPPQEDFYIEIKRGLSVATRDSTRGQRSRCPCENSAISTWLAIASGRSRWKTVTLLHH